MRNNVKKAWGAALAGAAGFAAATALFAATSDAIAGGDPVAFRGKSEGTVILPYAPKHQSVLQIRASDRLPITKGINLGRNKSMLIELPRELRDVVVSNPEIVDAVVQSSNRVYLIGKKLGHANAFFFDVHGEQILTLEIIVEQDTAPLDSLLNRLLPGANIRSEILNDTVILTGTREEPDQLQPRLRHRVPVHR